ncbi:MAG: hypothetical protein ACLR8Y_09760 [Alistipes indistinctus]
MALFREAFSSLQGGDFLSGFASGTLSTWIGHGAVALGITKSTVGQVRIWSVIRRFRIAGNGRRFSTGATTGLMVTALNQLQHRPNTSSGRYSLKFDGRELHVIDTQTGEVVYSTIATSGKGKHMNNPDSQNIQMKDLFLLENTGIEIVTGTPNPNYVKFIISYE